MKASQGGGGGQTPVGGGGSVVLEAHSGTFFLPVVAETTLTATAANTLVNHFLPSVTGASVTGYITNSVSGGRGRLTFPNAGFINLVIEAFITVHSTTVGTSGSVGHLVFEAYLHASSGTKKYGFESIEAIHDASSLVYRDPVSIVSGLIPVMANDYLEFKVAFESNVANKNVRFSIPAATENNRENIDVFFFDRSEVADWAKKNNATLIPADKLTNAPSGGGGLTQAQVDARIDAEVQVWARDRQTLIPADKLANAPSSGGGGGGSSTLTGLTDTPTDLGKAGQVLISETTSTKWDYLEKLGAPEINEMQVLRHSNDNTLEKTIILNPLYTNFDLILLKTKENGELESLDIRLLEKGDFTDQDEYTWDKDKRELKVAGDRKFFYVALVKFDATNKDDEETVSVAGYDSATLQGTDIDNLDFLSSSVTTKTSGEYRLIPVDLMKGSGLGGRRFETDTGTVLRVTEVSDNYLISSIDSSGSSQNYIHSLLPFKAAEVDKIVSNWSATATTFVLPENFNEWDSILIVYGTDAQATTTGVKAKEFLIGDVVNRTDLGLTYTASTRTVDIGSGNKVRFAGLIKYATVHDFDYLDVGDQIQETSGLKELYSTNLTTVKSTVINKTVFGDVDDTYYMVASLGGSTVETKQYLVELARTSGTDGEITYAADSITFNLGNTSTQHIKGIYIDSYRDQGTCLQILNNSAGYRATNNGRYYNSKFTNITLRNRILLPTQDYIGICADVSVNGVRRKIFITDRNGDSFNVYNNLVQSYIQHSNGFYYWPYLININQYSTNNTRISLFFGVTLYSLWYYGYNNANSQTRTPALKNISNTDSIENNKTITTIKKSDLVGDKCLISLVEYLTTGLNAQGVAQASSNRRYIYKGYFIDKTKNSGTDGNLTYTADSIKISGANTKGTTFNADKTSSASFGNVKQFVEFFLQNDYRVQLGYANTLRSHRTNRSPFIPIPEFPQYTFAVIGSNSYLKSSSIYPYRFLVGGAPYRPGLYWLFDPSSSDVVSGEQLPGRSIFYFPESPNYRTSSSFDGSYLAFAKIDDDEIITGTRAIRGTVILPDGWQQADYLFLIGARSQSAGVFDIQQLRSQSTLNNVYRGGITFSNGLLNIGPGRGGARLNVLIEAKDCILANFKDKKIIKEVDVTSTDTTLTVQADDLTDYEMFIFSFDKQASIIIPTHILRGETGTVDVSFRTTEDGSSWSDIDAIWNTFIFDKSSKRFSSSDKKIIGMKAINFGSSNYAVPSPQSNRPALPSLPSAGNFLGLRDTPAQYPGSKKFVVTKEDRTGLEFDDADTLDINASDIDVASSNFDNNLSSTDDDLQKVAAKVDEGSSTPKRVTRLPSDHTEGEEYYLTTEYPSQTFDVTPVTFKGTEFEGENLGTRGWARYDHVAQGGGGFVDVGAITPHHPAGLVMISDKQIAVKDGTLQNLRTLVLSVTTAGVTTITSRTLTLAQGTTPLIATSVGNVDTYTYNADLPAGDWDSLYFRDASNNVVGTATVKKGKYTSFNGDLQPSGFNADDADIDDEIKFIVEVLEKLGRTDKIVPFVTDGSDFFTANNPFNDPRITKVSYGRDSTDTNYYRRYVVFAKLSFIDDDANNTPEAIVIGTKTLNLQYFESDTGGIVRYRSTVTAVAGDRIASNGATKSINVRFRDKTWSGHDQINKYIRNLDIAALRSNILDKLKDYARKANTTATIPLTDYATTGTTTAIQAITPANLKANHLYLGSGS